MRSNQFPTGNFLLVGLSAVLLLASMGCDSSGEKWRTIGNLGVETAGWESIACHQGRLCLAFQDEKTNQVEVFQFKDSGWAPLGEGGLSNLGITSNVTLVVDSKDGSPYLAYEATRVSLLKANKGLRPKPQVSYQAFVQKLEGDIWKPIGQGPVGEDLPTLGVSNGVVYLAHSDGGKVSVSRSLGKSWEKLGDRTLTEKGHPYTWRGIFVDPDSGYVYATIENVDKKWSFVAKYDGKQWTRVGDNYVLGTLMADNGSLWVDHGNVYLAFHDVYRGGKATVVEYDGTQWKVLGKPGFSGGPAHYLSLVVYQGVPYLAYQDILCGGKAMVMQFTAGSWEPLGGTEISHGGATFESLALDDSTHKLYLAFKDLAYKGMPAVLEYSLDAPGRTVSN
ncbi:MAG TPA: hypothetical protein VMU88_08210 [bacterium]|nr:hypothetical protein [bacterium]